MRGLTAAIAVALLAACGSEDPNPCQAACDLTNPGELGQLCEDPCVPRPAGFAGFCFCSPDGTCPAGWIPYSPTPRPPPPTCR